MCESLIEISSLDEKNNEDFFDPIIIEAITIKWDKWDIFLKKINRASSCEEDIYLYTAFGKIKINRGVPTK